MGVDNLKFHNRNFTYMTKFWNVDEASEILQI